MKIATQHHRSGFRELKWLAKSCTETSDQEKGHAWTPNMRLSFLLESMGRGDASSNARTTVLSYVPSPSSEHPSHQSTAA